MNEVPKKIYLASKSPRRRDLLTQMGVSFEVLTIDIPEEVGANEDYLSYSKRVSEEKARAGWHEVITHGMDLYPVMAADTEVVYDNHVFGKPLDYDDAFKMWRKLAGNTHLVITSATLKLHDFEETIVSESKVSFEQMTDEEIHGYLISGDYRDKSGAYAIHNGYVGQFIKKIDGCFYSIMGLSLNAVRKLQNNLATYLSQ